MRVYIGSGVSERSVSVEADSATEEKGLIVFRKAGKTLLTVNRHNFLYALADELV